MALKKTVDTWKLKSWYSLIAPKFLNEAKVGDVPVIEDKNLINRTISVPLKEVTKNLNHLNISLKLRITEVRGKNAYTKFIGHEVAREGIKQLIKQHASHEKNCANQLWALLMLKQWLSIYFDSPIASVR